MEDSTIDQDIPEKPKRDVDFVYQSNYDKNGASGNLIRKNPYYVTARTSLLIPINKEGYDKLINYLLYYEITYVVLNNIILISNDEINNNVKYNIV